MTRERHPRTGLAGLLLSLLLLSACASTARPYPSAAPLGSGGAGGTLTVGFVVVDGVYGSELVAPHDIMQHTIFHVEPAMEVLTISHDRAPLRTFEGLWLLPDHGFADAPELDVLVVPSAEHSMDSDLEDEDLLGFVRDRGARASHVMSLCDGAFVLAAAGLFDGLEVTTFPADRERLQELFPELRVRFDVNLVHDGKAITSAGGALSYDPALYLCELLYGPEVTRGIARGLVLEWDLGRLPHHVGSKAIFPPPSTSRRLPRDEP